VIRSTDIAFLRRAREYTVIAVHVFTCHKSLGAHRHERSNTIRPSKPLSAHARARFKSMRLEFVVAITRTLTQLDRTL